MEAERQVHDKDMSSEIHSLPAGYVAIYIPLIPSEKVKGARTWCNLGRSAPRSGRKWLCQERNLQRKAPGGDLNSPYQKIRHANLSTSRHHLLIMCPSPLHHSSSSSLLHRLYFRQLCLHTERTIELHPTSIRLWF